MTGSRAGVYGGHCCINSESGSMHTPYGGGSQAATQQLVGRKVNATVPALDYTQTPLIVEPTEVPQMAEMPKWKRFEHLIHQIHEQYGISNAKVTLDDHIQGHDSHTLRQVDISIRTEVGPYKILIAIECKDHATPLDVGDVGAFATLRTDVRAHKGVLVATGGFTPAAIELGRSLGIDTRTYLDTESQDWGTEVAIPVVLHGTKLLGYRFTFSSVRSDPFLPFAIPTNIPVHLIELKNPAGDDIGPLLLLLGQRLNHDPALRVPGEHNITLIEHAVIHTNDLLGHARIEAHVLIEKRLYTGPLGIHLAGFRDEQNDSIHTKKLRTEFIEPRLIERGLCPGWRELEEYRNHEILSSEEQGAQILLVDGIPLKSMITLHYGDALPETREELEEFTMQRV